MACDTGKTYTAHLFFGWLLALIFVAFSFGPYEVGGCNEAVCASVVSKCMLTQSCKCDLKNCSCCKECFSCLSDLYSECCSCVDMCPRPNYTDGETGINSLGRKSHVEEFADPVPELFQALMSEPDSWQRWVTYTYPVDFDISPYLRPKLFDKEMKLRIQSAEQDVASPDTKEIMTFNCTVAYMSECMSWNKCRTSCQSTGATSYRWFHDGCCQCVGNSCLNYGLNESKCRNCPITKSKKDYGDDLDDDFANSASEEFTDYGSDKYDSDLE